MFIDPVQLIDQTIDHLQTLAAHFEDETSPVLSDAAMSPEARRCREALMSINVLIPKLRAARLAQLLGREPECCDGQESECRERRSAGAAGRRDAQEQPQLNTRQQRMCLSCED